MKKKIPAIIITAIFLMTVFSTTSTVALKTNTSSPTVKATNNYEDYTDNNGVIAITANDEFIGHSAVTPGGKGTKNNPYIIENWNVKEIVIRNINCYFEINHCYIYGTYGIYFYRTNNGKIQDCILETTNGFDGIKLFWSTNNEINDCTITHYIRPFYLVSYSRYNTVKNCVISDLSRQNEGVVFLDSDNNEIINCHIKDFDTYAFRLSDSNSNTITQCTVEGTGWWAIYMQDSSSNTFYHNNIINEDTHVNIEGWVGNNWDNGEEGNYWSHYDGNDDDRDGIGDKAYKKDDYPLIKSYGTPFPPTIRFSGGEQGWIGKAYDYFFKTKDHNNDMVYYYIDWGDGTPNELVGPYNPNEETPTADNIHIYRRTGDYIIRAKARDVNGDESDWSADFPIIMPRSRLIIFSTFSNFLEKFFEYFPMLRK